MLCAVFLGCVSCVRVFVSVRVRVRVRAWFAPPPVVSSPVQRGLRREQGRQALLFRARLPLPRACRALHSQVELLALHLNVRRCSFELSVEMLLGGNKGKRPALIKPSRTHDDLSRACEPQHSDSCLVWCGGHDDTPQRQSQRGNGKRGRSSAGGATADIGQIEGRCI